MNYKSTSIDVLSEELKSRIVVFEYTKKDGTVRTAKGTMNPDYLPEQIPPQISFPVSVIDTLIKEKNISSLDEYAKENGLSFSEIISIDDVPYYLFLSLKKKEKSKNLFSYYDIEKDSFRSFIKDNYLGIID